MNETYIDTHGTKWFLINLGTKGWIGELQAPAYNARANVQLAAAPDKPGVIKDIEGYVSMATDDSIATVRAHVDSPASDLSWFPILAVLAAMYYMDKKGRRR